MGLKIGIFTDSYRPYTSGVVRSIETFSEQLQAKGHKIYIFAPDYPGCTNENDNWVFRFPSVPAPTNHDYALAVPFSLRLRSILKNLDLDVIHVHSPFLLGRVGARYAKKFNIPLVFTFHTLYDQYLHYLPIGQNISKEITKKYCSDFCNHCDMVIVPTKIVKQHLQSWGVKTAISAIPTGIKTHDFKISQKDWLYRKYDIDPARKILISVGRLGKEKNFAFIIESLKHMTKSIPQAQLVLVGDGPEKDNLKQLAQTLGIEDKVIFTGTLQQGDVIKAYNSSHIFVFASVTETQGLVVGEAKAAGLPVVAVKAFGVSEMVQNGVDGFLTDLAQDQFVHKIEMLLTNKHLYNGMSQNAINHVEEISALNCSNRLLDCYFYAINKLSR